MVEAIKKRRVFSQKDWRSEFPIGKKKDRVVVGPLEPLEGANLESGGVGPRYQVLPQVASRVREL